jgi:hypothetical protein
LHAIKNGAPSVRKVAITSSLAAVRDVSKGNWPEHTYSEADWNARRFGLPALGRSSRRAYTSLSWEHLSRPSLLS